MALNLYNLGKNALRKIIPTKALNAIDVLDNLGINTGLTNKLPVDDPMRAYMWEVRFRDNQGRGDYITYYAKNTAIPTSMNESIKRFYAGVEYSYPGRDTSPRVFRVTFWDNQNLETYRFFQYWFDVMNQGADMLKVNPVNFYRDVELVMKDSSDAQELFVFDIKEAYPTEIGEVTLSYADNAEYTFDVMFSFRRKTMR